MRNDLHARIQTLARPRRGRIGVSDPWDSSGGAARDGSGGAARDDYLICYPVPAALLIPALRARRNELRRDYLHMRAPYQSLRLSAVQVVPTQSAKRTTVNVKREMEGTSMREALSQPGALACERAQRLSGGLGA